MKIQNAIVVYTHPTSNEALASLEKVKKVMKYHGISYNIADRDRLSKEQFKGKDVVIAVGGDGTFLRAAQFVDKQLLFGVNADVKNKEGFFMCADKISFEDMLEKLLRDEASIRKFPRLEAYVDGKRIGTLALNEFFIGPKKAYHSAKYMLRIGNVKERHKSSGILVATPAGTHAWTKACINRKLHLDSDEYQYVVREPYEGNVFKDYRLKHGELDKKEKVTVYSEMLDGVIVADSVSSEYAFRNGGRALIKMSKNRLRAVWGK